MVGLGAKNEGSQTSFNVSFILDYRYSRQGRLGSDLQNHGRGHIRVPYVVASITYGTNKERAKDDDCRPRGKNAWMVDRQLCNRVPRAAVCRQRDGAEASQMVNPSYSYGCQTRANEVPVTNLFGAQPSVALLTTSTAVSRPGTWIGTV